MLLALALGPPILLTLAGFPVLASLWVPLLVMGIGAGSWPFSRP
jgi:hypothetical protein